MIEIVKDPILKDTNTLLLLHGEDLTDSSKYRHTVTNSGVTVSTTQSKFGSKSLYFNGSSRLSISPVNLFEFGTGDWTFDAWVYPLSQSIDNFFFSGTAYGALFIGRQSGNGTLGIGRSNVAWDNAITSTLMLNTWNHVAYVKSSGKIYFFINGNLIGSANNAISYGVLGGVLNIGSQGANYYFNGYMDEVRMSSVARWTENFTPPSEPYSDNSITITSGGIIPQKYALRRRMMVSSSAPVAFEYTGNYTDNRDANGIGTVEFTSSGTLFILSGKATVPVYILAGGGGAARCTSYSYDQYASGGGGGNQHVTVELVPGTYQITIGTGGAFKSGTDPAIASNGGNSSAFGYTSTGGNGARAGGMGVAGSGGSPNGGNGNANDSNCAGGFPNGGAVSNGMPFSGGNGIVRLTFS